MAKSEIKVSDGIHRNHMKQAQSDKQVVLIS